MAGFIEYDIPTAENFKDALGHKASILLSECHSSEECTFWILRQVSSLATWSYAAHPKTLSCSTFDFSPAQSSKTAFAGLQF